MTGGSIGTSRAEVGADQFRDVIGHFATGVTVVTAIRDGQPLGTTANAVSSLCLEPPMLVVCLNQASATGQAIEQARSFGVSILRAEQAELARRFATKVPDKFEGVDVIAGPGGQPLLDGALAHLEGEVVEAVRSGTHTVFLARVVSAERRAGAPLAYFRGRFAGLQLAVEAERDG